MSDAGVCVLAAWEREEMNRLLDMLIDQLAFDIAVMSQPWILSWLNRLEAHHVDG